MSGEKATIVASNSVQLHTTYLDHVDRLAPEETQIALKMIDVTGAEVSLVGSLKSIRDLTQALEERSAKMYGQAMQIHRFPAVVNRDMFPKASAQGLDRGL